MHSSAPKSAECFSNATGSGLAGVGEEVSRAVGGPG